VYAWRLPVQYNAVLPRDAVSAIRYARGPAARLDQLSISTVAGAEFTRAGGGQNDRRFGGQMVNENVEACRRVNADLARDIVKIVL
jgi:hypothetical protein